MAEPNDILSGVWNTNTTARPLALEDLTAAIERVREQGRAQDERAAEAMRRFLDGTPEEFRDHPTIQRIAAAVAWSWYEPLHPRQAEALRAAYEEVVNG